MKLKAIPLIHILLNLFLIALFFVILIIKGIGADGFPLTLTILAGVMILLSYWAILPIKDTSNHQGILTNPWLKILIGIVLLWLFIINLSLYLNLWIAVPISCALLALYFTLLETFKKL